MDQPGKVASPARGQLNRENEYFPVRVSAWEFGFARRLRQSRPASTCSSPYSAWIWCLLTGFLPSSAAASIYSFITAIRHRVSPEFIGSRNCVPMGTVNLKEFRTSAALAGHYGTIHIRLSFPHPLLVWSGHVESIPQPFNKTDIIALPLPFLVSNTWHTETLRILDLHVFTYIYKYFLCPISLGRYRRDIVRV